MFGRRQASPGPRRSFQEGVPSSYSMFAGEGVAAALGGLNLQVTDKMKGLSIEGKTHQESGQTLKPSSNVALRVSNGGKSVELPANSPASQPRLSPNYFSIRNSISTGLSPKSPSVINGFSSPSSIGGRRNSLGTLTGIESSIPSNRNKTPNPAVGSPSTTNFAHQRTTTGSFSAPSATNGMLANGSAKLGMSFGRPNSSSTLIPSGKTTRGAPDGTLTKPSPLHTGPAPGTLGGASHPKSGVSEFAAPSPTAPPSLSLSVGSFQSMGARPYQEDFKQILDPSAATGHVWHNMLLGTAVYDGHGGRRVSQWLATQYNLLSRAMEALEKWVNEGHSPADSVAPMEDVFTDCGSTAINKSFTSGSCVTLALVLRYQGAPWIVAANVGDSRTILISWDDDDRPSAGTGSAPSGLGASTPEAVALSIDHKLGPPKTSEETRRVLAAGGSVFQLFGAWRIEGSLAVARAIGDCEFGRYVSYKPTVISQPLRRRDRWVIQASDGLWDVLSNAEVAQICRASQGLNATRLSEELVKEAVRVRGSADNTTVVATKLTYR